MLLLPTPSEVGKEQQLSGRVLVLLAKGVWFNLKCKTGRKAPVWNSGDSLTNSIDIIALTQ